MAPLVAGDPLLYELGHVKAQRAEGMMVDQFEPFLWDPNSLAEFAWDYHTCVCTSSGCELSLD